jgi:PhnB protein
VTRELGAQDEGLREPGYQSFSLAMTVEDPAEARRVYDALLEGGGEVRSPLQKTFFSPCFGMLKDRFGIGWMIMARG